MCVCVSVSVTCVSVCVVCVWCECVVRVLQCLHTLQLLQCFYMYMYILLASIQKQSRTIHPNKMPALVTYAKWAVKEQLVLSTADTRDEQAQLINLKLSMGG